MREILLTKGLVALVDDEDYETLSRYKWRALKSHNNVYYAVRSGCNDRLILMHREIMGDSENQIDHLDRNGLNNVRSNLRVADRNLQTHNSAKREDTTSLFKGVYKRDDRRKKWMARINDNGKICYLGSFYSAEEAAIAYDKAAEEIYGKNACHNQALGLIKL